MVEEEVSFLMLKALLDNVSFGNLSVHLSKLEEAGYLSVQKTIVNKKMKTVYKITPLGVDEFYQYIQEMEKIIQETKKKHSSKNE